MLLADTDGSWLSWLITAVLVGVGNWWQSNRQRKQAKADKQEVVEVVEVAATKIDDATTAARVAAATAATVARVAARTAKTAAETAAEVTKAAAETATVTTEKIDSVYAALNGNGVMGALKEIKEWQDAHSKQEAKEFVAVRDEIRGSDMRAATVAAAVVREALKSLPPKESP